MSSQKADIIIVAGAGKGIGLACVKEILSSYPNHFVLACSRNIDELTKIGSENKNLFSLSADFSNISLNSTSEIISRLSNFNLKGIIFTAGILEKQNLNTITKSFFDSIYQNNVWSLISLIQIVSPYINNSTHIVTLGSMGGHTGTLKFSGMSTYSSSKAALACLTECIAEELKSTGASANCLNIGAVSTDMMKTAFPDYHTEITPDKMARFIVNFTLYSKDLLNGKVIPVSSTIP